MKLVWKLLRQHISVAQMAGFFLSNLLGMAIILIGIQFYSDISPLLSGEDNLLKQEYVVVTKKVGMLDAFFSGGNIFTSSEIKEIENQSFVNKVGAFSSSQFSVIGGVEMAGSRFSTQMFFESVPDAFLDVRTDEWKFDKSERRIPIIIPRNYLNLYNFGFAQSQGLPQLSEGMIGMVNLNIYIRGTHGERKKFTGRVVGFSNRINTILVPKIFMDWANEQFAGVRKTEPARLILEVGNSADERIASFFREKGYEIEGDKLDSGKVSWFLQLGIVIIMCIGGIICLLSIYILVLSIYLLLQKNMEKLENLLLLGYMPSLVAKPYRLLAIGLNTVVCLLAIIITIIVRESYLSYLENFGVVTSGIWFTLMIGLGIITLISLLDCWIIENKISTLIRAKR